jgi:hypothetical protein
MKRYFFAAIALLFGLSCLAGCGGGGSAHGATDSTKNILVLSDAILTMKFPDGTTGGADTLRTVASRLKEGHKDSLGFEESAGGYTWVTQTIPPATREVVLHDKKTRAVLHVTPRHATRGASYPYNVLLKLADGTEILITDSAVDLNLLAIGYTSSSNVTDALDTEADIAAKLSLYLPASSPQADIAETTAIVAYEGFNR